MPREREKKQIPPKIKGKHHHPLSLLILLLLATLPHPLPPPRHHQRILHRIPVIYG
jgi:hypothetical protein